jgi:hypothetical protein
LPWRAAAIPAQNVPWSLLGIPAVPATNVVVPFGFVRKKPDAGTTAACRSSCAALKPLSITATRMPAPIVRSHASSAWTSAPAVPPAWPVLAHCHWSPKRGSVGVKRPGTCSTKLGSASVKRSSSLSSTDAASASACACVSTS